MGALVKSWRRTEPREQSRSSRRPDERGPAGTGLGRKQSQLQPVATPCNRVQPDATACNIRRADGGAESKGTNPIPLVAPSDETLRRENRRLRQQTRRKPGLAMLQTNSKLLGREPARWLVQRGTVEFASFVPRHIDVAGCNGLQRGKKLDRMASVRYDTFWYWGCKDVFKEANVCGRALRPKPTDSDPWAFRMQLNATNCNITENTSGLLTLNCRAGRDLPI